MKSFLLLTITVFVFCTFNGSSQMKVYTDNRVKIFGDRSSDDPNKDLSIQIYGKYGDYLANGKIGFGDYNGGGFLTSKRVFVGEAGNSFDSDRLELCGSDGIYLTWGQGYSYNNIVAKIDLRYEIINNVLTNVSTFNFNTDVYAHGFVVNSDERFKENIEYLDNTNVKLSKVNPVSYNLKPNQAFSFPADFEPETNKQNQDLIEIAEAKEKMKILEKKRYGFVAQDLQKEFPELVAKGEDGLYVDYLGLLPVLVETIKMQQLQLAGIKKLLHAQKL